MRLPLTIRTLTIVTATAAVGLVGFLVARRPVSDAVAGEEQRIIEQSRAPRAAALESVDGLALQPAETPERERSVVVETARKTGVAVAAPPLSIHPEGTWRFSVGTPAASRRAEGHRFVVELLQDGDQPATEILRGCTDANGAAVIDWIPSSAVSWDTAKDRLRCRLTEPGLLSASTVFRPRGTKERPRPRAYIKPFSGVEVDVQLVDVHGDPINGSFAVESADTGKRDPRWLRKPQSSGITHVVIQQGVNATLRGWAPGVGSAAIRFDALRERWNGSSTVPLIVQGSGSISGVLLSAVGEPLPDVQLAFRRGREGGLPGFVVMGTNGGAAFRGKHVIPASYAGRGVDAIWTAPEPGLFTGVATTNARGEFRVDGLVSGEFSVRSKDDGSLIGHLTSGAHATSTPIVWNRVFVSISVESEGPSGRRIVASLREEGDADEVERTLSFGGRTLTTLPVEAGQAGILESKPVPVTPGISYVVTIVEIPVTVPDVVQIIDGVEIRVGQPVTIASVESGAVGSPENRQEFRFTVDASHHEQVIDLKFVSSDRKR